MSEAPSAAVEAAGAAMQCLLARRSVSPRRLVAPGPSRQAMDSIIEAALRAPDHADLKPWRVIEFPGATREVLADLFEAEKRRREPLATAQDVARAREHATSPPVVLAFVVRTQRHALVPEQEQVLSAGAALGSILIAAHALGFGAMVLSGERCRDRALLEALGLARGETMAGFIGIGTIAKPPPAFARHPPERVWSQWRPEALRRSPALSG